MCVQGYDCQNTFPQCFHTCANMLVVMVTVNKQLADKERVAAAMENDHLLELVNQCLKMKSLP